MALRNDDRGVSESLGFIMGMGTLFIFLAATFPIWGQIASVSTQAQENQAEFEGQRLASEIQRVDRLVRSSDSGGTIGRHIGLSSHLGNNQYTLTVVNEPDGDQYIIVETERRNLRTKVEFRTSTPVENTTVSGGELFIVRKGGESEISIEEEGR